MTVLTVKDLAVTLGTPLFSNLSFTIAKGDRIGLVAVNGRGKSTLLSCLSGAHDPTAGDITQTRGLRVGYVRQHIPETHQKQTLYDLVLAALPPEQADYEAWRVDMVLAELEVPYELQQRPLAELSGGWQRTALLAATWVTEPDLLLLDEPTNHLDLNRIALLQKWLSALPQSTPVVITSHDRAFLDATTQRTLFLRPEHSVEFPLSFTAARAALAEQDEAEARRAANDLKQANQLRKQAAKLNNIGINSGSDLLLSKQKHLTERAERIEAQAKPAHQERGAGDIRLSNSGSHAKALVTLDDIEVTAPDGRLLYRTGKKWISPGDRVVVLGANGTGKTQLIRHIQAALQGNPSAVTCAASIKSAYADQHLSQFDARDTPLACITAQFDIGDQRARSTLAGAGISFDLQNTPIRALSGGQKARLALLALCLAQPNFYLLDEPTNHLDIDGQEALEHELVTTGAACVLVSHDRYFLRKTGTRYWWIQGKRLEEVDSPDAFLAETNL